MNNYLTSLHVGHMTKAIASIKWLIGALLGYSMVGFIFMSFIGRMPLLAGALGIVAAIYSGIYAKKHLVILFLALIAIYAASFWNMTHKINKFCESINVSTKPSDLIQLSDQAGVEFRVSEMDIPGNYFGSALNPFTLGEHACKIYFTKEKIISRNEAFSQIPTTKTNTASIWSDTASFWFEQSFWDGDSHIHAIFTQTPRVDNKGTAYDCHVCGVMVGVVTYKQVNGKWEFISMQPEIAELGQWGHAPEVKQAEILQLAPDNVALLINERDSGQGYYGESINFIAYAKNKWHDLGFVHTGEGISGNCSDTPPSNKNEEVFGRCWSYKGKVSIKTGSNSEYPDLLVTLTGTEAGKDELHTVPVKRVITYVFNGEKYVESKAVHNASESN